MHGTIAKVGVLNCAALVVLSLKVILKYCHFDIYFFMPSVSSNLWQWYIGNGGGWDVNKQKMNFIVWI